MVIWFVSCVFLGLAFGLEVVGGMVTHGGVVRACVVKTVQGTVADKCISKGKFLSTHTNLSIYIYLSI